jgi:hypothetical protein
VPFTGHSVVTSDLGDCAKNALTAFFTGQPVAPCANERPIVPPTPIAPTRLGRLPGRTKALKTVAAVGGSVRDIRLQFLGDEIAVGHAAPAGSKVAGLRSGSATASSRSYRLRRVEYVPGVTVTGNVPIEGGSSTLTVSGRAAAHGKLTYHPDGTVTGRLNGRKISVHAPTRAAAAVTRPMHVKLPRYRRVLQLG